MKAIISKSKAMGSVFAPPSKSLAHRALICGAFSNCSVITNISYSKDIEATLSCLEDMGAVVEKNGNTVKIGGLKPDNISSKKEFYCHESGSTLRFLIPICMLSEQITTLTGRERLFERPLSVYEDICKEYGIYYNKTDSSVSVGGSLQAGEYFIRGDISSQFITGLLFALSLLKNDSKLTVTGKFESASYVDLTLYSMKMFGVIIERINNVFYIKGGQNYKNVEYCVEGDCSNAAFLDGFNMLGGAVDVKGVSADTLQGDRVYKIMYDRLKNGEKTFDLSDCPDLAPVMIAIASVYGGAEFTGTARLRIKESDRASAMAQELKKFGINVQIFDNSVLVEKGVISIPKEELCGHNDHRIVMALSLLCTLTGGVINDAEAVSKSYPEFFNEMFNLGIDVKMVKENEN